MNPWDHFPPYSHDTRWLHELLGTAMDGAGAREVGTSRRGLRIKHNGLVVCEGKNLRELRTNYEAITVKKTS